MVEWRLIARCGARYTVAYGGGTVLAVGAVTRSGFVLLGLVVLGFLSLLFVMGGTGTVRMGSVMANSQSPGINGTVTDPAENDEFAETMAGDLKLLFYGVGLILFGFAGTVVVGSLA